jgi:hypothetical protein
MPMPPPPSLLVDLEKLLKMAEPLLEEAYVFSQIVGHILVAADQQSGPPPTYYIGDLADNPSSATNPNEKDPGPQIIEVFNVSGTSATIQLANDGSFGVFAGSTEIASVSTTHANGAGVINGNPTILSSAGMFPVAGEQSTTGLGPLVPGGVTNIYMMMPDANPADPGKHMYYTCGGAGTNYQPDTQYPAQVFLDYDEVKQYFTWAGVSYPGAAFPMWPSVAEGIQKMASLIASTPGTFAMAGYSEGAIVSCRVWRDYILNPNGQLHDRLNDIIGHLSWGNPLRCPTIANGNVLANIPIPGSRDGFATGGISGPDDLTSWQTMPWHIDFAHEGDLYTDCPVGLDPWSNEAPPGAMETAIYKLVAEGNITGRDSLLLAIGELLTQPFEEIVPLIEALINGIQFLGNMNTHNDYTETMVHAADWLTARGRQIPVRKV